MKYYIEDKSQPKGFIETTETEYMALFGDDTIRPYVQAVYCGEIAIDDVPYEYQETVQAVVSNKVNRWGLYESIVEYEEVIDPLNTGRVYDESDTLIEDYPEITNL